MSYHGQILLGFLIALVTVSCVQQEVSTEDVAEDSLDVRKLPREEYGFVLDSFDIFFGKIQRNEFLADILTKYDVPYGTIHEISERSKEVYDVRKLGRGKNYLVLCSQDSSCKAKSFIYEANDIDYVVYDFSGDSIVIRKGQKPVTLVERRCEGIIERSLYETLQDSNHSVMLAFEMADIFAWTIDFYRLQPGAMWYSGASASARAAPSPRDAPVTRAILV